MKIVLAIVAVLLVVVAAAAGIYLYTQSTPPQDDQGSQGTSSLLKQPAQTGPSSPYKIPESLERAIKQNQDTVAWINVPNTDINNSVVQTKDNDFYLRRDETKADEIYGCYFADYECSVGEREVLEPNTIIYGHSSPGDDPNGKRFSQLFRLNDIEIAKATPYIYLATPNERLTFEIFAVFYTLTDFEYIRVQISNDEMREITKKAEELSIYKYPAQITADDKILTLSTCSEIFSKDGNGRFVVMAKLLPQGAKEVEKIAITAR